MFKLKTSCVAALSACLLVAFGAWAAEPLTVDDAVRLALERNPTLFSLRSDVEIARAGLSGASLVFQTNPEFSGSVGGRASARGSSVDVDVGVAQRLEIFGQRGARREAAQALLVASEARRDSEEVNLAAQVREAFGRSLAAELQLELSDAGRAVALSSLRAAEERFAAGGATRIEVNTARVETGRATREFTLAQQRRVQAQGELALLAGLGAEELKLTGTLKPGAPVAADEAVLVGQALAQRPDLRAARSDLEAAKAEQRLASRELLPSPRLGVSYTREEDSQIVLGTLGIDLPIFNQNQAARGTATARVNQAEQRIEARTRLVKVEVGLAFSRYRAATFAAGAYAGDVLKAMEENTQLVTEAYRAGKVDFLELLIIQRQALDARRGYLETLEELNAAEAQLKRVTGRLQ